MDKLGYSIRQAMEATSLGRSELYERISSGEIESIKVGKRRIIPAAALRDWIDRLRDEQRAAA